MSKLLIAMKKHLQAEIWHRNIMMYYFTQHYSKLEIFRPICMDGGDLLKMDRESKGEVNQPNSSVALHHCRYLHRTGKKYTFF